jgi:hypothetical protein
MVISNNSQLGLRFADRNVQVEFLRLLMVVNEDLRKGYELISDKVDAGEVDENGFVQIDVDPDLYNLVGDDGNIIGKRLDEISTRTFVCSKADNDEILIDGDGSKFFFICDSVYKAANLIKIGENFTGRTLKDINFGKYTYLMGKNRFTRFVVMLDAVRGFYYDDKNNIAFEWGIDMRSGAYYFDGNYSREFSIVMQILTFVELGDIEIIELRAGKNNGGDKKTDKVTNTSKNTVYVVDSTWNQIIIRTEGFAVRGHFRLQTCGVNHADRKMIWVGAFEKHGYKRTPKAKILHD